LPDRTGSHQYRIATWHKHLVAQYTGLDFIQLGQLNYIEYLKLRRDAFINYLSNTEKGQEYLDNAWRCEQTKADRAALRKKIKGKEGATNGE
jgi:hypothetical protein